MNLSENTILITGGASGIGLVMAKRFIKKGSKVIICGRRAEQLDLAKLECPKLITYICDLTKITEREILFNKVITDFPQLNILINNAGIQNRLPPLTEKQDWQRHEQEIATNLHAPMHLSMLFIQHLMKVANPAIINVTSGLSFAPISFMPTYCTTKAALHSFTLSLRHQLKNTSIKVIELIPPAVNTDLGGKGLHTEGANLDLFVDHCMNKLAAGEIEFGYESSEVRRLAVKAAIDPFFNLMNK
jgi:uncharacterized oxidoreductase